jgi:hypothetical protein
MQPIPYPIAQEAGADPCIRQAQRSDGAQQA